MLHINIDWMDAVALAVIGLFFLFILIITLIGWAEKAWRRLTGRKPATPPETES